ncbi:LEA type 2 family protein [Natrinema sp. 1APR25-10V2]|uniref:LEA type 2 family protein n=1 Tax=Natrinema sp. 1APR25-10V2 TaxID=2951081 RepID=UPI00287429EF|nr:LEA type 2 family protein [Natrinema sp. 1APR25-10V2]MDS0476721.1 LEA type 2 family protein [Natrinema sp. 1APR25-10V2]
MVRRRTWLVTLVALVLIVATVTYGVLAVDRPRVESVENEWGTVTSERTEIETEVAVDNPFLLRLGDAAADVSYSVSLNDVEVAAEEENRVRLAGDESTVTVSTWIDNDKIPAWWASHVNNDETTTVRVEPDIVVDYAGIRVPAEELTRTRTVHTNLLEPLATNESRQFQVSNQTVFVVDETDAQWGNATVNRTPIEASATVTNSLGIPVPITQLGYTVRLNGIVVGQGVAARQTVLEPNQTRTLEAGAAIDNSKLDEWWVTHRRQGGASNLTVDFNATVALGGVERTLPLDFISYERQFRTDLFGAENASGNASANESASDEDGGRDGGREPAENGTQLVGSDGASRSRGV